MSRTFSLTSVSPISLWPQQRRLGAGTAVRRGMQDGHGRSSTSPSDGASKGPKGLWIGPRS